MLLVLLSPGVISTPLLSLTGDYPSPIFPGFWTPPFSLDARLPSALFSSLLIPLEPAPQALLCLPEGLDLLSCLYPVTPTLALAPDLLTYSVAYLTFTGSLTPHVLA